MKYIDEYRDLESVREATNRIREMAKHHPGEIVLMEVCGTHTTSIFRSGIRKLLPQNLCLLSGPGCPVCVTPNHYLDKAIAYAREEDVIITTFGDMVRVPGSSSSLERERSAGCDVVIVYSCLDALKVAAENHGKKIIFLGIGFETTAPTVAATIKAAREKNVENFFVLCGHKLIPPAMRALVESRELRIDGFICPGHVSTIIGANPYEFIASEYNTPCVITGFEPLDVVQGIFMLVEGIVEGKSSQVQIQYSRAVKEGGNKKALDLMQEVFKVTDSEWRGIGSIPDSGLSIEDAFSVFDADCNIEVEVEEARESKGCICGEILRGVKTPLNCKLFRKGCTPESPIGACMVSSEGTCAAYYKFESSE